MCVLPITCPPSLNKCSTKGAFSVFAFGENSERKSGFPHPVFNPLTSMLSLIAIETFSNNNNFDDNVSFFTE